jgi:hypothetical protein
MRAIHRLLLFLALLSLSWPSVRAAPGTPNGPQAVAWPDTWEPAGPQQPAPQTATILGLPPLKAVCLVGPFDGDDGPRTTEQKAYMDLAAAELQAHGVTVHKFYTPNTDWNAIKAAAQGAHFLLYRGHGVGWPTDPMSVGGFYLNYFVSPDQIRRDLHLAPNAIVMLLGCFTAGSAGSDPELSSQEAQCRVAQYSRPFLDIGAAGYYANQRSQGFQMFVRYLFQGQTLGQAYQSFWDFDPGTFERYNHPHYPDRALWLDKGTWHHVLYNNAFVGWPERTLAQLFPATAMRLSTTALHWLTTASSAARTFALRVSSTTAESFAWSVEITAAADWMTVEPQTGMSGQILRVTLNPEGKATGSYTAQFRVRTAQPGVGDANQLVDVQLHVHVRVYEVYFPVACRASRPTW